MMATVLIGSPVKALVSASAIMNGEALFPPPFGHTPVFSVQPSGMTGAHGPKGLLLWCRYCAAASVNSRSRSGDRPRGGIVVAVCVINTQWVQPKLTVTVFMSIMAMAVQLLGLMFLAVRGNVPQGTYPFLLKNSMLTLNSSVDINATVAWYKQTKQSLVGVNIDQCYFYEALVPLLKATRGSGIRVFGTMGSHNGPIYCPSVWGTATCGQQVLVPLLTSPLLCCMRTWIHIHVVMMMILCLF